MGRAEPVPEERFSDHQFAALNARLVGDAVHPRHPDYHRARRIWNYMIDRRPAVVVRCQTDADVAAAIAFARECSLPLAVKGGGHSVAGHSMVDDGVVIDLSRMRQVTVAPDAGRVRVGGGCLLADMDRATQAFGLATPAGVMSETGVAGLALGGGMGWLTRKHGLTCDSLVSARVVLADGRVLTASADENPDLYWGLRGAGTNFGVVTEFEFATQVVGITVPVGIALYDLENAGTAIGHHAHIMRRASNDLKVMVYLRRAAAEPGVPDDLVDAPVCMFVSVWTGDPADAMHANEELWAGAPRVSGSIQTLSYVALQSLNDNAMGPGACNYTKGGYAGEITDGCIEGLIESAIRLPNGLSAIEFGYQHGAQDRLHEDDTAFADRHADHIINILGRWQLNDEPQRYIDWVRETFAATTPWQTGGLYANFMALDDDDRVRDAYRNGKYERLATIKAKYDPDNIFNSNPNIQPAKVVGRHIWHALPLDARHPGRMESIGVWASRAAVSRNSFAFGLARAVITATRLGVFESLILQTATAAEIASRCRTDAAATQKLLMALAGSGYLFFHEGRYALTPTSRTWMTSGSPRSLVDAVLFAFEEWDLIGHIEDYVRVGTPVDIHERMTDEQWDLYQRCMRALAGPTAQEVAQAIPVPCCATDMIDVGGSHGHHSVALCRRHPRLRSMVLDLPEAVRVAAPLLAAEKMGPRVVHLEADALAHDFGADAYDVVLLSNLAHHFSASQNADLFGRLAQALRPRGVFAVIEPIRPETGDGVDQLAALNELYFGVSSRSGTWTARDIAGWQCDAGLRPASEPIMLSDGDTGLHIATKV